MKKIKELTAELAAPAIAEQGCTLWDVEYVKEAGTWYLRILLDKEGGVDILDCEEISRKVSDLLDEADPIPQSYYLEVGSPGLGRRLTRPEHYDALMGQKIRVRLYRPDPAGRRELEGALTAPEGDAVTLETAGGPAVVALSAISKAQLCDDEDLF